MKYIYIINSFFYQQLSHLKFPFYGLFFTLFSALLLLSSNSLNAQTPKDNEVINKDQKLKVIPSIKCSVKVITKDNSIQNFPCNNLVISLGDDSVNYHYDWHENNINKYGIIFAVENTPSQELFAIMIDSEKMEFPLPISAEGKCEKKKIDSNIDQLMCNGVTITGDKFIGDISLNSFDLKMITSELNKN